ncbi:MAG: hypothetical protein QY332_19585 [Anaerolineales bacterium]|nr:MAG: hypothetical protein QY332_19585 [Anaerolineales bacterium]
MGDYNRATMEITLQGMSPEMKAAADKHIEQYELGSILDDAIMCVEAASVKIKKGVFAGPGAKTVNMVLILTQRWLVQIIKSDNEPALARSAQLTDITVEDYENSQFYSMIPDTGVNVSGRFTDAPENSMSFIGLGKDAAGERFKSALIEAARNVKK